MPSRSPSRHDAAPVALLATMFIVSGATSLAYETIWARELHLVFGTSQLAITTVLAAFLGGLALGALAAARWAGRVERPLVIYALLEAAIGAYALVFPRLATVADSLALMLRHAWEPTPLVHGLCQFALLALLLVPPSMCMGATLPLLARYVTARQRDAGRLVGRLYGANTIGAVVGTALAGFVLLPRLGLAATTWVAVAGNMLLALAALAAAARTAAIARATRPPAGLAARAPAGILLAAGIAGFASLVYELAWFRLMVLLLGGSAYAFSIMLLAFLLGIGLGGWLGGGLADRALRRGGAARVLLGTALLQAGVAALAWAALRGYGELPVAFVRLYDLIEGAPALRWPAQLALALAVMLPPALLMGATFPFLVRAAAARREEVARTTGQVYGVNAIGCVLGAVAAGFLLLPSLHVRGTVLAAAAFNLVGAIVLLAEAAPAMAPVARRRLATAAVLVPAIALLGWRITPPWDPMLMTSGFYQYAKHLEDRSAAGVRRFVADRGDLVFYAEGLSSVVTVGLSTATGNLWLANNGKIDASSRSDMRTQVLLTELPFLFRPDAERVLVVGLASGISAGSATLHEAPGRIDIVEIEPAVVAASRAFDEVNHRPLEDPRVRLVLDDARHHLRCVEDGTYDLVMSEPSNPWISGVANLFTREFFELGRRKLAPDGVWAQWLHMYGMKPDDLRSLLGSFADVFEHVRLFRMDEGDLVLVGSGSPLPMSGVAVERAMHAGPSVAASFAAAGVLGPAHLIALYCTDRDGLLELAAGVQRNTDDNMRVEYSAPLSVNEATADENLRMLRSCAAVPLDAVDGPAGLTALAVAYLREGETDRAAIALAAAESSNPADPVARGLRAALRE